MLFWLRNENFGQCFKTIAWHNHFIFLGLKPAWSFFNNMGWNINLVKLWLSKAQVCFFDNHTGEVSFNVGKVVNLAKPITDITWKWKPFAKGRYMVYKYIYIYIYIYICKETEEGICQNILNMSLLWIPYLTRQTNHYF